MIYLLFLNHSAQKQTKIEANDQFRDVFSIETVLNFNSKALSITLLNLPFKKETEDNDILSDNYVCLLMKVTLRLLDNESLILYIHLMMNSGNSRHNMTFLMV